MNGTISKRVMFWPELVKADIIKLDKEVAEHRSGSSHAKLGVKSEAVKPFGEDPRLAKVMKVVRTRPTATPTVASIRSNFLRRFGFWMCLRRNRPVEYRRRS